MQKVPSRIVKLKNKLWTMGQDQRWLSEQTGLSEQKITEIFKHGFVRKEEDIEKIEKVLFPDPEKVRK